MVKMTYASGYVQYNIERKIFWWWEYMDGYWDEDKALMVLDNLRRGVPYKRKEIMVD
jgi:hypothetical protein